MANTLPKFQWTDETCRTLIRLWQANMPTRDIAVQIGCTRDQANEKAMHLRRKGVKLISRRAHVRHDYKALAAFALECSPDSPAKTAQPKPRLLPRQAWFLDCMTNELITPTGKRQPAPNFRELKRRFDFNESHIATKERVILTERQERAA